MQITVTLPDDLASHPNPGREALEALAIEGYRSGSLTALEARLMLGIETRYEFEGFLKSHAVWDHSYSYEDLQHDLAAIQGERARQAS